MDGVACVAIGSCNTRSVLFGSSAGLQSLPVACIALGTAFLNIPIADHKIDEILHDGDRLHKKIRVDNQTPTTLEDIPLAISVDLSTLTITQRKEVVQGIFPTSPSATDEAVAFLERKLHKVVGKAPLKSGYIFTGPAGSVAFWQEGNSYLVFQPIGATYPCLGEDPHMRTHPATVVRCPCVRSLSHLLLQKPSQPCGELTPFTVTRVRFFLEKPILRTRFKRKVTHHGSQVPGPSTRCDEESQQPATERENVSHMGVTETECPLEGETNALPQQEQTPMDIPSEHARVDIPQDGEVMDTEEQRCNMCDFVDRPFTPPTRRKGVPPKKTRVPTRRERFDQPPSPPKRPRTRSVISESLSDNSSVSTADGSTSRGRGRPKTSTLTRAEQLQAAQKRYAEKKKLEKGKGKTNNPPLTCNSDSDDVPLCTRLSSKASSVAPDNTSTRGASPAPLVTGAQPVRQSSRAKVSRVPLNTALSSSEDETPLAVRGRPRSRLTPRKGQNNKHTKTYNVKNPEKRKESQMTHSQRNPEPHRATADRYSQQHPEVNRAAAARYSEEHPEVHRAAAARYSQEHPQVHRAASARYSQEHPEVHREAVRQYDEAHPENVQQRQQNYTQNNPDAAERRRAAQARYRAAHPEVSAMRHLKPEMVRHIRAHGPAGYWEGDNLNLIEPHRLKNPSLYSDDTYECPHCKAKLFDEEVTREQWCCGQGKYNVQQHMEPLTAPFYTHPDFLERARAFNDLFAFCAQNISGGDVTPAGLAFYKIQGRMYHKIYSLASRGQSYKKFNQFVNHCRLYLDDGQERQNIADGRQVNPDVRDDIEEFMRDNPIARDYRRLGQEDSQDAHLEFEELYRHKDGPVLGNPVLGREVHAVMNLDEHPAGGPRSLTVWKNRDHYPTKIDVMSDLMEPFQYPLLYPEGTRGWSYGRRDNTGEKKLSQFDYTRCLLLSQPRFYELGRLSQAWQCEMYARFEEEKLRYIERCQKSNNVNAMRVAPLNEINDAQARQVFRDIQNDETIQGEGGVQPGKIVLPSTFVGSPRYMKKQYLNSMTLVSRKGPPTFFITFTASGKWDEVRQSTRHGTRCDPSISNRVFQIKLKELLNDLKSGAAFGKKCYIIHVIEFQQRGLAHAHIAFRVEDGGPTQARDIDKVVRADIPGPDEAGGRLRELVLKHMIHGPCGTTVARNPPCWDDKKKLCTKHFPKPQTESTHTDERGFVKYRRRHDNTCMHKNRQVHDGWVVPYNPFLLLKYDCHINVEIASTRRVVKYLFKYLMKGASQSNVRVVPLHLQENEVEEYVTRRMIGASDACWRLLTFHLTKTDPATDMLQVHLEGQQNVMFKFGQHAQAAAEENANPSSDLLLYMKRPDDPIFDNVTYQSFHENYMIHTKKPNMPVVYDHPDGKHFLTPRKRGEKVTRIHWVSPRLGELFYLRLLLASVPCRGFDDLKRRGGDDCTTFQDAAKALGLVDNEREYSEAITEAHTFMAGPQLRAFFVTLCNVGAPAALLWDVHKHLLAEDHLERHPDDPEKAFKLALIHIDRMLRRSGSCNSLQGLPDVTDDSTELGREVLTYSAALQQAFLDEWEPRLTAEQREVLEHVKTLLTQNPTAGARRSLFLDGPGGYGKTQLLKVLTSYVRSQNKVALCVASSGIAAQNMPGGTTAHNMFRLPLDLGGGMGTWNISNSTQRADLVRAAELIIFDEAPMAHRHLFEMLDRSLQDLMGNRLPFGGKIFLCSGDFRQIPPVVPKSRTAMDIVEASLKSSELWPLFRTFRLTTPQRTSGSPQYSDFLLSVGEGRAPEVTMGEGRDEAKVIALEGLRSTSSLDDLIEEMYPPDVLEDPEECAKRAILCPLIANVQEINNIILDALPGDTRELRSFDQTDGEGDDGLVIDEETLHEAKAKGVPDHVLSLKVGAVCLITRNLNVDQGLVNGTKVVVQAISPQLIRVKKAGSDETFGIPRIVFKFAIVEGSPLIMTRRQFPLQLAYAMSFHKSQGQTIDKVGLDLRTDCFTHGQLYVGLSRVRDPSHISVLVQEDRIDGGVAYTKNICFQALLL